MTNYSNPIKSHIACEKCGSSDAKTVYDDGHSRCYACGNTEFKKREDLNTSTSFITRDFNQYKPLPFPVDPERIVELKDRGITKETAEFYNVWLRDDGSHTYPYFDLTGKIHKANKFRTAGQKGFLWQGDAAKTGLFGQQLFPAGSAKQITLVEGEVDALSVFQMTGMKWPCVSVKNAATAQKDVADNYEYLSSFEKIVICFDNDDPHKREDGSTFYPGQEAAQKVAGMFPLGKVRLLTLKDAKDANDYLKNGWGERFIREWWNAPTWSPVGLRNAKDMWEEVIKEENYESIDYPWEGLNKLTYGIRTSELVTITALPGVGKTLAVQEIVYKILQKIIDHKDGSKAVGLMMLENSNKETLLGLMSLCANKPLHLPDVRANVPEAELKTYFDTVYGGEKVIVWEHFGSTQVDKVLDYVRHMAALGCKHIVLDHLSIVVSDQSGDERKQLDEISTKLKTFCMEKGIALICIIHQNRKGEIRGTMGVEQLSNIVIKLHRDIKSEDVMLRNITKVTVDKNRFCGRTGPACLLSYDSETGRLAELPDSVLTEYLEKNKKNGFEEEW